MLQQESYHKSILEKSNANLQALKTEFVNDQPIIQMTIVSVAIATVMIIRIMKQHLLQQELLKRNIHNSWWVMKHAWKHVLNVSHLEM